MKRLQHRGTSLPAFYERYPTNGCVPVACALLYADGDEDLAQLVFNELTDHLAQFDRGINSEGSWTGFISRAARLLGIEVDEFVVFGLSSRPTVAALLRSLPAGVQGILRTSRGGRGMSGHAVFFKGMRVWDGRGRARVDYVLYNKGAA